MKANIKQFDVKMEIGNNGLEVELHDNGDHFGDVYITKKGLIFCEGKIQRENGIPVTWKELRSLLKKE